MRTYLQVLDNVLTNGKVKGNRTGVGARYIFSEKFRHDMSDGFPLLTTKKINPRAVLGELFGFLTGADTVADFQKFGCNIWNSWGLKNEVYDVIRIKEQDIPSELAAALKITVEEAEKMIADHHNSLKEWTDEYNKVIQDVSTNSIKTAEGASQAELMALTNDILAKRPDDYLTWLTNHGVTVYVKNIMMPEGYLGPIYGKQWLEWRTSAGDIINQIKLIADQIEKNPLSRRIVLTGWNPEFIPKENYPSWPNGQPTANSGDRVQCAILDGKQALPPCHMLGVFDVDLDFELAEGTINLEVIMRSTDVPIGLPYNIASYAFLLSMVASQFGYKPGVLVIEMINCHVYEDQVELALEQVTRTPTKLPTLGQIPQDIKFDNPATLTVENMDRILDLIEGYEPQAFIRYPVAV